MTSRTRENPWSPAHQRKEECPLAHRRAGAGAMKCSLRRRARHKRSAQQTLNLEGSPSGGYNSQNLLPTGALLLPMSPVHSVTHVSGPDRRFMVGLGGLEPPTSP